MLMLHAFGHAYSPWSDMAASFRAEIIKRSPQPIDLYEVSLDTARVQDPEDDVPFVEYIKALLSRRIARSDRAGWCSGSILPAAESAHSCFQRRRC